MSRSSRCVATMEPWECVATKIASAAWRSSIHWLFAVKLEYNLRIEQKKIYSVIGIYDIPISEGWELYTLIDAFANRSFAFQRNLRHLLDSYAMLFLKRLQRLAHHVDKFVACASRLQNTWISNQYIRTIIYEDELPRVRSA